MINVDLGAGGRYCMVVRHTNVTIGRDEWRDTVEVEIYTGGAHGRLLFCNKGISFCHPDDMFDAQTGAHKALVSALEPLVFTNRERQEFFKTLKSWFH